jgi:cell wall-associated NlpC family hydrolase
VAVLLAASAVASASAPAAQAAAAGAAVVRYAERFSGAPYRSGGTGPTSFDCSGFVMTVYAHFGVRLPRTSYEQMAVGAPVTGSLHRGDLLFWGRGAHVGLYIGHRRFVSATSRAGVADYALRVWARTQTFTTARRLISQPGSPTATTVPAPEPVPDASTTGGAVAPS